MQTWTELLEIIQAFYVDNPGASLSSVRQHIQLQPIVANEELDFQHAKRIDDTLFGVHQNTHWVQAFSFPHENTTVTVRGETYTATHVGVFTFTPAETSNVQT